jgi:hypothetical protein
MISFVWEEYFIRDGSQLITPNTQNTIPHFLRLSSGKQAYFFTIKLDAKIQGEIVDDP